MSVERRFKIKFFSSTLLEGGGIEHRYTTEENYVFIFEGDQNAGDLVESDSRKRRKLMSKMEVPFS